MTSETKFPAHESIRDYVQLYSGGSQNDEFYVDDLMAEHELLLQLLKTAAEALEEIAPKSGATTDEGDYITVVSYERIAGQALQQLKDAGVL